VVFTRWKSPDGLRIPSVLSLLGSHDPPFLRTLIYPYQKSFTEAAASLTTPRSSNGRMILLINALVIVSLSYNAARTETLYGGFVQDRRFRSGWVWGSWNGIESGFVDDKEFNGLRDGRCTPPTVHFKTLAPGNPQLPVIDLAATSDDVFVPAR
jgi:hypothetical protein